MSLSGSVSNSNTKSSNYSRGTNDENWDWGPWAPQGENLQRGWDEARRQYERGVPEGDRYAQQSPEQRDAYRRGHDWASGRAAEGADRYGMMDRWGDLYQQHQDRTNQWGGMVDSIWGTTAGDLQGEAAQLAQNDPYANQSIAQSWENVNRQLDRRLGGAGGINDVAASTGNMDSSRAGVAEGVARSEATTAGQQAELGVRQRAYDQAQGLVGAQMDRRMGVAGMYEPDEGYGMGLLQGGQQIDTTNDARQRGFYSDMEAAGAGMTAGEQINRDNEYSRWADEWGNVQNYNDIVGSQNWGQQGRRRSEQESISRGRSNTSGWSLGGSIGF